MTAGVTGTHALGDTTLVPDSNAQDAMLLDHETRLTTNTAALTGKQSTSAKGIANGYAGLDGTGKVPAAQLPTATSAISVTPVANQTARLALSSATVGTAVLQTDTGDIYVLSTLPPSTNGNWSPVNAGVGVEVTANKDANNGYAGLDSAGKVTTAHLPDAALNSIHVTEYHPFDFRRYGAVGNGSTDNTTAFQTAIADIAAVTTPGMKYQNGSGTSQAGTQANGGGELHIPPGTFVIGNVIPEHRMRIVGEGWGSVLLRKASTSGPWIQNRRDGTKHAGYIQIANLTLNGNRANQSSTGDLVTFNGDTTFTYTDTKDEDFDVHNKLTGVQLIQGKGSAVRLIGSGENSVSDCDIRDFDAVGIWSEGFDNRITNNTVGWCGTYCIRVDGDSVKLNGNKAWYSTLAAYYITSDQGSGAGNEAQDAGQQGFLFDGANGWALHGTSDSSSRLSSGTYAGVDVYNSHYLNLTMTVRNRYRSNGTFGPCKDALNHAGGSDWNFGEIVAAKGVWGVQNSVKAGTTAGTGTVLRVNGVPIT